MESVQVAMFQFSGLAQPGDHLVHLQAPARSNSRKAAELTGYHSHSESPNTSFEDFKSRRTCCRLSSRQHCKVICLC